MCVHQFRSPGTMSSSSYDVFLSFSGEHRHIVKTYLYKELICRYPEHRVFYDKDSICYGDCISAKVVGEAQRCRIFVAVLSEEYFTRSRSPMMELAASYTAFKEENSGGHSRGGGVPLILPVFLALKPELVKDRTRQRRWYSNVWKKWENDDRMCESNVGNRPSRVEPALWLEAVSHMATLRGMVYEPQEYQKSEQLFMRAVAESVHSTLGILNQAVQIRARAYESTALQAFVTTEIGQSSSHPGLGMGPGLNTHTYYVYNDNRQYQQNHPPNGIQSMSYTEPWPAILNRTDLAPTPCSCQQCQSSAEALLQAATGMKILLNRAILDLRSSESDGKHAVIEEYVSDDDDKENVEDEEDGECPIVVPRVSQLSIDGSSGSSYPKIEYGRPLWRRWTG